MAQIQSGPNMGAILSSMGGGGAGGGSNPKMYPGAFEMLKGMEGAGPTTASVGFAEPPSVLASMLNITGKSWTGLDGFLTALKGESLLSHANVATGTAHTVTSGHFGTETGSHFVIGHHAGSLISGSSGGGEGATQGEGGASAGHAESGEAAHGYAGGGSGGGASSGDGGGGSDDGSNRPMPFPVAASAGFAQSGVTGGIHMQDGTAVSPDAGGLGGRSADGPGMGA